VFLSLWIWVGKHPFAAAVAVALFLFLVASYYSSLFTNLKGTTSDLINSLLIWRKTGTKGAGHEKPWPYFLQLLWRFELPILAFGLGGAVYAFVRRNVFMIFTALWAVLLLLIYSSVPYKTPWLALNFILPLAVLAGGFFENVYRGCAGKRGALTGIAAGFFVVNGAWLAGKSWKVNFVEYDDDRNMIVYSQTRRDVYDLLESLNAYAAGQQGLNTQINIITDEYWPLNWYLHNYEHTAYWGRVIPDPDAPIVIGRARTQAELEKALKDTYLSEMYSLRPGVDLILYLRQHKGKTPEEELKGDRPLDEVPADLAPGLVASYYNKISPVGEPVRRTVESDVYFRLNNDEEKVERLGLKAPLSIVWEGLILIPSDGTYYFATESDDGSWVFVDDKLVVDNGGNHGNQYVSGEIELTAGYHRFRVKYFDSAWGAWMKLVWTPPGGAEAPIPADRLLHSKAEES
nr:PA14 domain-containing protein [bacterium]